MVTFPPGPAEGPVHPVPGASSGSQPRQAHDGTAPAGQYRATARHRVRALVAVLGLLAMTGVVGALLRDDGVATPDVPYSWRTMAVGGGGWVTGLSTSDGGALYARTDVGGAYRWDRDGSRWVQMIVEGGVPDPDFSDYVVEALATAPSDGDRVYMTVGDDLTEPVGRVLVSDDAGRSWEEGGRRFAVHGNAEWRQAGSRLAVDPEDPDLVLLGTRTEGLWLSDDAGTSWRELSALPRGREREGEDPAGVTFAVFDPDGRDGDAAARFWVGVAGAGVFLTEDGGESWTLIAPTPDGVPRDADLAGDHLYVAVGGGQPAMLKIDRGGATSESLYPPDHVAAVAVSPADPDLVFAGNEGVRDGYLFRSRDGGSTWDELDVEIASEEAVWPLRTRLDSYMSVGDFAFEPSRPDTLWFAEGMGVWRSSDLDDDEVTWDFASTGIEELVSSDAVKPPGRPLLTAHWDRNLFRHPDGEPSYPPLSDRFNSAWSLDVAAKDPDAVVAVVSDHRSCCIEDGLSNQSGYSADGGQTWRRFGSLEAGTHPEGLEFGNIAVSSGEPDDLVWVPSNGGAVHYSGDRGDTWRPSEYSGSEPHFAHYLRRSALIADASRGGTFYVLDADGVQVSQDAGATWRRTASRGLPGRDALRFNATLLSLPGRAGELLLTTGLLDEGSHGLFRSSDAGESWTELPGLEDVARIGLGPPVRPGDPTTVFASGRRGDVTGLWRSGDLGRTWQLITTAPLGIYQDISVLVADPDVAGRVYVGFSGTGFVVGTPS